MGSSLRTILSLLSFFAMTASAADTIRVCLWEGSHSPTSATLSSYRDKYRGSVYLLNPNKGSFLIINKVELEEYLYGVVGTEMGSKWPFEALKAQAVCSRTLAVIKRNENSKKLPYDVKNSILHQVYGSCEEDSVIRAVDETRGEILTSQGAPAAVFFHAACGGMTSPAHEVWKGGEIPWLQSVADPYCVQSPYSTWTRTFSRIKLQGLLDISDIADIQVSARDTAGRAREITITRRTGKPVVLHGKDFRQRINNNASPVAFQNPSVLPGTRFSLSRRENDYLFTGSGYGHGVGLCQWGAHIMAENGMDYRAILAHFFPLLAGEELTTKEEYGD